MIVYDIHIPRKNPGVLSDTQDDAINAIGTMLKTMEKGDKLIVSYEEISQEEWDRLPLVEGDPKSDYSGSPV